MWKFISLGYRIEIIQNTRKVKFTRSAIFETTIVLMVLHLVIYSERKWRWQSYASKNIIILFIPYLSNKLIRDL